MSSEALLALVQTGLLLHLSSAPHFLTQFAPCSKHELFRNLRLPSNKCLGGAVLRFLHIHSMLAW